MVWLRIVLAFLLAFPVSAFAVDINGQLKNAQLEKASSDPSSNVVEARVYYNTGTHSPKVYNGTNWTSLGGSGSGQKSYVPNGSSTATGWAASSSAITVATDSTAADLPEPSVGTGIKITGVSGSSAFVYTNFTLDQGDYSRKLSLQFYQNPLTGYVASDFRLDVYSCTVAFTSGVCTGGTLTRLALTPSDTSAVSVLANYTGPFATTFDAPTSTAKFLQLQIGLNTTATHAMVFSSVTVGPGLATRGSAITEALSYTPTITGVGTATNVNFWYRRVGTFFLIWGSFTTGTVTATTLSFTLPNSYTIDSTKVTSDNTVFGVGTAGNGVAQGALNDGDAVLSFPDSGDYTKIYMTYKQSAATNLLVPIAASSFMGSSKQLTTGVVTVPVAELAGSGVVNLSQIDGPEFAFNTNTANGGDTTSFGYGPAGSIVPNITQTVGASSQAYRARFLTAIQSTDKLGLEFEPLGSGPWLSMDLEANKIQPFSYNNAKYVGVYLSAVTGSTTDVDINFGTSGASNTAAYGSATTTDYNTWSSLNGNGMRYRLRKQTMTQAVGFGTVTGTSSGLMPSANTSLDDSSATRLGLKQYVVGTAYTNGTPAVTLSSSTPAGSTLSSVARSTLVPYQTNDGSWRMKLNISLVLSSTARTAFIISISGVTFKNSGSPVQALTTYSQNAGAAISYVTATDINASTFEVALSASSSAIGWNFAGDVELNGKPTWAY